jgi:hypothetical protein
MAYGFKIATYGFLILAIIPVTTLYLHRYYYELIMDLNTNYYGYYIDFYDIIPGMFSLTGVILISLGYLYIVTARYYYENNSPPEFGVYRSKVLFMRDLRSNVLYPPGKKRDQIIISGLIGIFLWIIVLFYYFDLFDRYRFREYPYRYEIFHFSTEIGFTVIESFFYIVIVLCLYRVYTYFRQFQSEFEDFFTHGLKLLLFTSAVFFFIIKAASTPANMLIIYLFFEFEYFNSHEYISYIFLNGISWTIGRIIIFLLMLYSYLIIVTSLRSYRPRVMEASRLKPFQRIPPKSGRAVKARVNTEIAGQEYREELTNRRKI